ncbi:MAG: serine hydrolase, partial [Gemmatimonadota bacterium]|nr:serine hydrolase [Gemmatimonadota bacterium]
LVAEWVEGGRIPGAVLLVSRGDEVVLARAYGWRRVFDFSSGQYRAHADAPLPETPVEILADPYPMTRDAVFDLASVTKVMATTYAVMLLVDRHEIDLDAPVRTYLPDFRGGGKESVTIRHLLTHRAGFSQWKPIYYHAEDADEAYAYVRDLPLEWPVGESRHYSDLGFILLGSVVERVTGTDLNTYLADELYRPLGLRSTGFRPTASLRDTTPTHFAATSHGNPYEYRMVHDTAFGYRIPEDPTAWNGWRRHTLEGEVNDGNAFHALGGVAGHAGLFSSADDLHILVRLLLDGGVYGGRRYLTAGTVETFLESTGDEQALGWLTPAYAPAGSFAHTGFTGTFVLGARSGDLAVVLLTNRQHAGLDADGYYPDVGPLQRAVARALLTCLPPGDTPDRRGVPPC